MKRLFFIRHAKSSWESHGLGDRDRPLNERGERDAPLMAQRLKEYGLVNPHFLISTAKRTIQTGKIVTGTLEAPTTAIHHIQHLYLATGRVLLETVIGNDAEHDLVIIGHNPGISDAASMISGEHLEMVTSHVVGIELHVNEWAAVSLGTGSVIYNDYPKKHPAP